MKLFIIIAGLLCAVCCKPAEDANPDYLDDGQGDDYLDYTEQEEVPEESNAPKPEDDKSVQIISPAETFVKNLGETVILPCEISSPEFVRLWLKNGVILYQSTMAVSEAPNRHLLHNGNLQISDLHEEDGGQYECSVLVTNKYKPKIAHTLTLITPPRIESLKAKNNVLKTGDTLELTCEASGYPKPVISWHKGNERLQFEGEVLKIEHAKHHHAGEYKCLADNKIGQPAFSAIHITIEHKPVVSVEQINVNSDGSSEAILKCVVHSEPRANVVWTKGGMNIIHNEHTHLSNQKHTHQLIIKDVQETDFGVYACSAVNYLGNATKTIKLVKTPAILRFIKPQPDNKNVVLTWEVQSKQKLSDNELQYRKKGESNWLMVKPEVSAEDEVYTVKYELKGLDPGVYETRIRSQNEHGWSEYSEIMPFEGVFVKHGHHKSHKKGHREGKAKHTPHTQEISGTTQSINTLNSGEPAEHQENYTVKDASVKVPETSGSSSPLPTVMLMCATLIFILQIRLPVKRI